MDVTVAAEAFNISVVARGGGGTGVGGLLDVVGFTGG